MVSPNGDTRRSLESRLQSDTDNLQLVPIMPKLLRRLALAAIAASLCLAMGADGSAQGAPDENSTEPIAITRPHYKFDLKVDYDLLTFAAAGSVSVPIPRGETINTAVFYLYADAAGVGGSDEQHKNVAIDSIKLDGAPVPFDLNGALLHVHLPAPETQSFTLDFTERGVVPRSTINPNGLMEMMGAVTGDLGSLGGLGDLLGGGAAAAPEPTKPKNVDYGLYTYAGGMLSLGSFWYPALAVRHDGAWVDEQPSGLGDVLYADMSDFDVTLRAPAAVVVAATGAADYPAPGITHCVAHDVRDFSVLMSQDYVVNSKVFTVGDDPVTVQSFTLKQDESRSAQAIDIAGHALQIYARRFGSYTYHNFKVVEGPIRGGAGGMEFSGLTSISCSLYQDLGKEMNGLASGLGAGDLDKLMGAMEEDGGDAKAAPAKPAAPANEGAANPATDMLQGLLGQQKGIFDSLFEMTIAHETGHQWWAMGVGSDSQRDPFLDESLTNYSAMIYFEDRYGKDRAAQMQDLNLKTTYNMARMMGAADAPANWRTSRYTNNIQYGAVVYGKGALYYDAARKAMGDDAFFASLRDYYARYRNHLAGPRSLEAIMAAHAPNGDIDALYKRWIEETHGDEDVSGGHVTGLQDMLGTLMGGAAGGE